MKPRRSHAVVSLLAALAACGGGSAADQSLAGGNLSGAGVVLTTGQSAYPQGAVVGLSIQNQESERLAYNTCTRALEVHDGTAWVPGPVSLRLCTKNVWYVEAGETRADSTDLDLGLVPGEYRIVLTFARDFAPEGEVIRSVSNSITITP